MTPGVSSEPFGEVDGAPVERWTLSTSRGVRVRILTYGGILQTVEVPDRDGRPVNVALGFADVESYARSSRSGSSPYFGAIVGRFANRIAGGRFALDGTVHQVPVNQGGNALHGGSRGFDQEVWAAGELRRRDAVGVRLTRTSPHGEMGFPGTLRVQVDHLLGEDGELRLDYTATTDAPTVVNLTSHAYWNLAGEGSGTAEDHELTVRAAAYTPVDAALLPTGEIAPVEGTPFDLRSPTRLGARLREADEQLLRAKGYDHNWVLDGGAAPAAEAYDPGSGRRLTVTTTEPGLQFYSGNFLDGTLRGTSGRAYRQGDAFALETQHFPDSPNQPHFPSTVLRPGETFRSSTAYRFSVDAEGTGRRRP